jgi:hypothetical protein
MALRHDVDRIVQHHVCKVAGGFGHEHTGPGVFPGQYRQGTKMVLVRMRQKDGVKGLFAQMLPEGLRVDSLVFGMGAAIQDKPSAACLQQVTVGSDFDLAGEVGETDLGHCEVRKAGWGTKKRVENGKRRNNSRGSGARRGAGPRD